jgi:hypothetical protein
MKMLQEIRSEIKNNDHLTKSEKNMLLRSVRVLVIKFLFLQSVIPLEWEKA